jgi:transmembrane sensor
VGAETDNAFRRWLQRDQENEHEFERRELLWELTGELRRDAAIAELTRETQTRIRERRDRALFWRWHPWKAAGAAAAVALVVGWWETGSRIHLVHPLTEGTYTTRTGEQRWIVLGDGSRVEMNTASRLRVRFAGTLRSVTVEQGEAVFFVQRDVSRPFEVEAGSMTTRALGTVFNVRHVKGQTDVTVLEGHVRVHAMSGPDVEGDLALSQGQAATYDPVRGLKSLVPADLARISSWQAKRVEFRDLTLASAVDDFNRYSEQKILIGDRSVKELRVTGVFHFGDVTAFTDALRDTFGIRSHAEGQAVVLLAPPLAGTPTPPPHESR